MKYGTTSFHEGCMKDASFEEFEETFSKTKFRDENGNAISNKDMFKAMGGKPAKKSKKDKD